MFLEDFQGLTKKYLYICTSDHGGETNIRFGEPWNHAETFLKPRIIDLAHLKESQPNKENVSVRRCDHRGKFCEKCPL